MRWPTKDEVQSKLLEYPLLRQLFFERWFRLAFVALALMFVFFALFLPKLWTSSPRGFLPVIKVSGLDLVQAWSLQRTALKAAAAGRFDEANHAWQAALANNRADPDLVRGALQIVLKDPQPKRRASQAVQQAFWLLKLTGTNVVDLELAAQILDQYGYYDPIISLAESKISQLTPGLAAIYLRALFHDGRMQSFDARWNQLQPLVGNHPVLALYRAAYLAGWGPPDSITAARQQLEAATADPALRLLAYRLKLALNAHEMKAAEYSSALKKLEEAREDSLTDHTRYWRLLARSGEGAQAARLAEVYPHPPASALEAVELAQIYSELGLRDQTLQMLRRYTDEFGHAAVFWVAFANELLETKRWEELRNLALQIRTAEAVRDQLGAFSYFLEGRAELALGRQANALAAFQRAADRDFPYPSLGQRVAGQLAQWGYPELAKQVLERLEPRLQSEAAYWVLVFRVADQLKDVDLLVRSATRAYQLAPRDPVVLNNYAAALIIVRRNPDEAIRVTLPLFSENPNSLHALVNHSAALLLNNRPKEAEALLSRVPVNELTPAQSALYNLDLFETYVSLRQFDLAWNISDRIQADLLYPPQREWLRRQIQQLPPRPKAG